MVGPTNLILALTGFIFLLLLYDGGAERTKSYSQLVKGKIVGTDMDVTPLLQVQNECFFHFIDLSSHFYYNQMRTYSTPILLTFISNYIDFDLGTRVLRRPNREPLNVVSQLKHLKCYWNIFAVPQDVISESRSMDRNFFLLLSLE